MGTGEAGGEGSSVDERCEGASEAADHGGELCDALGEIRGGVLAVRGVREDGERGDGVAEHRVPVPDEAGEEVQVRLLEDLRRLVVQRLPEVHVQRRFRLLFPARERDRLCPGPHARVVETEVPFQPVLCAPDIEQRQALANA